MERDAIYRRRRFPREVIEGRVRWHLTYRLSYRDLVDLMAEWGVHVSHTTIMRWGPSIRAGIREAMEPPGEARWLVLAHG